MSFSPYNKKNDSDNSFVLDKKKKNLINDKSCYKDEFDNPFY